MATRRSAEPSTPKLTLKQEAFCHAFIECGGNASEAYRQTYDVTTKNPDSIHRTAFEVLTNPKVASRINQLQQTIIKRHETKVDDIIAELEEARELAKQGERPQVTAMVAATMGKAKVLGLANDRVTVTGADGGPVKHAVEITFVSAKHG